MQAYRIERFGSVDGIELRSSDDPRPGLREVLMRVRASSLNYRDLMVLKGGGRGPTKLGVIPLSDGAGEVAAIGDGATRGRSFRGSPQILATPDAPPDFRKRRACPASNRYGRGFARATKARQTRRLSRSGKAWREDGVAIILPLRSALLQPVAVFVAYSEFTIDTDELLVQLQRLT